MPAWVKRRVQELRKADEMLQVCCDVLRRWQAAGQPPPAHVDVAIRPQPDVALVVRAASRLACHRALPPSLPVPS